MDNLRFILTLRLAQKIYELIQLTKAGEGTSFIGQVVLKLYPNFLETASKYIKGEKIAVTGTNGKTTTCGIISHILETNGRKIIANKKGANMLTGITNAFALGILPNTNYDNCVIESDEAYLVKIHEYIKSDYLLVTNLFRDQLDRYGELDTTKQKIQEGINKLEDIQLILNADDPLVASLQSKNKKAIYYGINTITDNSGKTSTTTPEEIFNCPCGKQLKYTKKFYAQQGHYYCDCGYKRPTPDFEADVVLEKDYSLIKLGDDEYKIPLVGLFNAYNALGAIALLKTIGIKNINKGLESFKTTFGRSEVREVNGHKILIQLIKNPTGASEVIKSVDKNSNILIIINDNYADGRDVSWLWDADFERFKDVEKQIVVSGIRAEDMAVRLKYTGFSQEKITVIPDIKSAIDYTLNISENNITILPTYTALLELNKIWKKL